MTFSSSAAAEDDRDDDEDEEWGSEDDDCDGDWEVIYEGEEGETNEEPFENALDEPYEDEPYEDEPANANDDAPPLSLVLRVRGEREVGARAER